MAGYYVDREGCVVVRDCECGSHGVTSLWTDHDGTWRSAHRVEAAELIDRSRTRRLRDEVRFDVALDMISKERTDA